MSLKVLPFITIGLIAYIKTVPVYPVEIAIYSVGSAKLKQKHIHGEGIPVEVIPFNADRVFLRVLKAYRFKTPFSLNYG